MREEGFAKQQLLMRDEKKRQKWIDRFSTAGFKTDPWTFTKPASVDEFLEGMEILENPDPDQPIPDAHVMWL